MKIRNYLLGTLLFMIAFWVSAFAFEPNQQQQEELASFKGQIAPLVEKDNYALWNFYEQARDLHLYFKEEKTAYYLEHWGIFFWRSFLLGKTLQNQKVVLWSQIFFLSIKVLDWKLQKFWVKIVLDGIKPWTIWVLLMIFQQH